MAGVTSPGNATRISVPPQVLVLGGVSSVQFGSAFANKLFAQAGPAGVVFLRLLFGAIVLMVLVRPRVTGRSRADWRAAVLFGAMLAGMNWSFYEALDRLPLGPAVTIEFLGPLTVAVLGSRRLLDVVWVMLAGGGVALLGLGGSHSGGGNLSTAGILLALLAGTFWAGYIVMSKRIGSVFAGLDGLATALVVGGVLLIPAGVSQGGHALLEPRVLAGGLAVALLSSVIPYSLELTALRRMSAAAFGLLMSLEPAVAALAGVLVLGQALRLNTTIALIMVVLASAGSTLTGRRSAVPLDA
ncbi:MAG: inner rane transporter RhtA [Pseudonocardiales bacterium]|nr:inner rane transporter RhtA [Pseudonocardiales bacterium]